MKLVEEKPLLAPRWIDYGTAGLRFRIKGLSGLDLSEVQQPRLIRELTVDGVTSHHFTPTAKMICVVAGLVDWDGVFDDDGKPVDFHPSLIKSIPDSVLSDLAYEVYMGSILDELTKKKSSSKPTSSGTQKSTTAKRAPKGTATKKTKRRTKSSK